MKQTFHSMGLQATPVVFLCITYPVIVLRGYVRIQSKRFSWDDGVMVTTQTAFTLYCAMLILVYILSHDAAALQNLNLKDLTKIVKYIRIAECLYIMTMLLLKVSLSLFFLRLIISREQRWLIFSIMILYTLFSMAYCLFAVFQCKTTDTWEIIVRMIYGQCINTQVALVMNYTHAIFNAITDWACAFMPIGLIYHAHFPRQVKWASILLLVMACMSGVASLIRIRYIKGIIHPETNFFENTKDLAIWSTIEPGIGIIVASLATLRPLLNNFFTTTYRGMRRNTDPNVYNPSRVSVVETRKASQGTNDHLTSRSNGDEIQCERSGSHVTEEFLFNKSLSAREMSSVTAAFL